MNLSSNNHFSLTLSNRYFNDVGFRFMSLPRLAKLTCGSIEARTTLTAVFLNTFSSVETWCGADTHLKWRTVRNIKHDESIMLWG